MRLPRPRPFDRDAFIRDSKPRLKKGLIAAVAAFLVITLVEGPTATLVLAFLLGLALYIPAWQHVPLGRFAVLATVIVLVVGYPFYQEHMFQVPIFGGFPSVDTAVTML